MKPDNSQFSVANIVMGNSKLTEGEQNRLIIDFMEMVEPIASEYRGRKGIPFEDLVAAGREGLVLAARGWRQAAKFQTYAHERIHGTIKNFIESWQHLIPIGDGEEIERNFHEWDIWGHSAPYEKWTSLVATPEDLAIAFDDLNDRRERIEAALKFLPKMERNIIWARYFRDPAQTLNSIAREYKMPYATLVDFINRTLKKLKERLEERQAA